ncbi:28S ribosomal protein S29, mitochondrial [Neltuma alba]|uniref:28S ribosomal protein S29, mitochondrial n=1 Tax=Neltuma alba TaxID=207710 RepID=UPI0010A3AE0B|nr:28S ribosomal protein S29, mitochondrial [Prosopis alba]
MLRSALRAAATSSRTRSRELKNVAIPALSSSSESPYSTLVKSPQGKFKLDANKPPHIATTSRATDSGDAVTDVQERQRLLKADENKPSLDVGPNGRPLFTASPSLSQLSREDTCSYFKFTRQGLDAVLPEGLPSGMVKEFEESMRTALLVRQSFLDLRDNFRRVVDPPMWPSNGKGPKVRKQIVLDGPLSCGKSIALAMLVQWAREEGWLVFYVPRGQEWTHGGFFYKHPGTGLWDTPVQAEHVLKDFMKYNESHLKQLPCQIFDPIPLGEGAGVGWLKDVDSLAIPEGTNLYELVKTGIEQTHAAVGVVVRLRKELSLVKDMPVLIAIDQYNNWFTFSAYEEPVSLHSCRPIHARELTMVKAFRSMMHNDMMVGAFSHSTAVGKLRKDLPDVPADARVMFPRYSLNEAETVCHYYLRQRLIRREAFSEENWKKMYFLSNGNGSEIRGLAPFMR